MPTPMVMTQMTLMKPIPQQLPLQSLPLQIQAPHQAQHSNNSSNNNNKSILQTHKTALCPTVIGTVIVSSVPQQLQLLQLRLLYLHLRPMNTHLYNSISNSKPILCHHLNQPHTTIYTTTPQEDSFQPCSPHTNQASIQNCEMCDNLQRLNVPSFMLFFLYESDVQCFSYKNTYYFSCLRSQNKSQNFNSYMLQQLCNLKLQAYPPRPHHSLLSFSCTECFDNNISGLFSILAGGNIGFPLLACKLLLQCCRRQNGYYYDYSFVLDKSSLNYI